VILDVVYNHTAEGNEDGPTYAYRGLSNCSYYILGPKGEYYNYTGCGNTVSCNHPITRKMILDSLRYWVGEMHVDGFRFDLASILTRDTTGAVLSNPPIIESIASDPILANCKLIAEAWDAAGLYQVGSFPAHERFAEWNGKYRDTIRRFIKGTDNEGGNFSSAICGSQELYAHSGRKPYHSINFITSHDGFTLRDLVSYNQKHNEENGERNQDGMNDNDSWNCGEEGLSNKPAVNELRERQMRNFIVTLFTSIGTPMLLMGDEYGHTRKGNNNTYCHDNDLNWFLWDKLKENEAFYTFVKQMIAFRKTQGLLRRTEFLTESDVDWHGVMTDQPDWSATSRFIAYTLKESGEPKIYIAYNASNEKCSVKLPDPPAHAAWKLVVDTNQGFFEEPQNIQEIYPMEPYSALIAVV
ncbi:MAG: glycogen-debranching protein, partial [Verrucomicrobia bacterium]|nr:glycogen-debranching protein [Verrucomicrobiota bacterium]